MVQYALCSYWLNVQEEGIEDAGSSMQREAGPSPAGGGPGDQTVKQKCNTSYMFKIHILMLVFLLSLQHFIFSFCCFVYIPHLYSAFFFHLVLISLYFHEFNPNL